jgi:hypothetical protein
LLRTVGAQHAPTFDVWLHGPFAATAEYAGVTEVVELRGAKLFFSDERAGELVSHLRRFWRAVAPDRRVSTRR